MDVAHPLWLVTPFLTCHPPPRYTATVAGKYLGLFGKISTSFCNFLLRKWEFGWARFSSIWQVVRSFLYLQIGNDKQGETTSMRPVTFSSHCFQPSIFDKGMYSIFFTVPDNLDRNGDFIFLPTAEKNFASPNCCFVQIASSAEDITDKHRQSTYNVCATKQNESQARGPWKAPK